MKSNDTATSRDSDALGILGIFFLLLGSLVLAGTFWTWQDRRATIVNVCSGIVLLIVAVGMRFVSARLKSSPCETTDDANLQR